MDPFAMAIGGGSGGTSLDGGSSEAASSQTVNNTFGGYGTASYNFGGGSINNPNWLLIGGLIVAALVAVRMLKK